MLKDCYAIFEENHGFIGLASTLRSAWLFLCEENWIDSQTDVWFFGKQHTIEEMMGDVYSSVGIAEWLAGRYSKAEDFENLGFHVRKYKIHHNAP